MSRTLGSSSVNILPNFDDTSLRRKLDEISKKRVDLNAKLGLDTKDADGNLVKFMGLSKKTLSDLNGKIGLDSAGIGATQDCRSPCGRR